MSLDISEFKADIDKAIADGGNIWENICLEKFKSKVKQYYRDKLKEQCCYCRKNTHGEFKMVLDIEHVLPKSIFSQYIFSVYNLSVSCKRCNMHIKKDDISFVTDVDTANKDGNDTKLYKIIHPNIDEYFTHLEYFSHTVNDKTIVKYRIVEKSIKGEFTYNYFKLKDLEIDTINKAQGAKETELSEEIDDIAARRIVDLLQVKK